MGREESKEAPIVMFQDDVAAFKSIRSAETPCRSSVFLSQVVPRCDEDGDQFVRRFAVEFVLVCNFEVEGFELPRG